MDARTSKRQKRISKTQEMHAAIDLRGRLEAASGAAKFGGGDVRVQGKTRLECKVTEKGEYSVKLADLEKVQKQAARSLEAPVLQFAFRDRLGKMDKYAVIPFVMGDDEVRPQVTTNKSITLHQDQIRYILLVEQKRLRLEFRGKAYEKRYEVLSWNQYLELQKGEG